VVGAFNIAAGVSGLILNSSSIIFWLACLNLALGAGALLYTFVKVRGTKTGSFLSSNI